MPGHTGATHNTPERRERLFLAQQCGINLVVTIAMTMLLMVPVFRGRVSVPLWGNGILVLDLIASIVMPCIGATFALTKAINAAAKRGLVRRTRSIFGAILPINDLLAGLTLGFCLVAVLSPAFICAAVWLYGTQPLRLSDIIAYKLIFAVILTCANTPVIIARARARL